MCVRVCPSGSIEAIGRKMDVRELIEEIRKDRAFFDRSGGGVTLSGGEPTAQAEFAACTLRACREDGFNTALETCGHALWTDLRKVLRCTDLVFYDLKHMDPVKHKKYTGVSNKLIKENLMRLSGEGIPIIVRVPIVPGYNDSETNMRETAAFVSKLDNILRVELLPYHKLGQSKYARLDRTYELEGVLPPTKQRVLESKETIESYDLPVEIVGFERAIGKR